MRSRRDIYAQAQFIFTDLSYGNFDSADMRDAVFEQVDLAPSSSPHPLTAPDDRLMPA